MIDSYICAVNVEANLTVLWFIRSASHVNTSSDSSVFLISVTATSVTSASLIIIVIALLVAFKRKKKKEKRNNAK